MDSEPRYTVYIRLPFPRGDFVDPPPVNWDTSKDEALWNILSGVSKTEIDWDAIATKFEVTVEFLLQQVTYLTERHASQVRAQMRKVTASKGSAAPSPVPGSDSAAAMAAEMRRTGSGGGGPGGVGSGGGRAPSSLSVRKDSPLPRNDGPNIKPAPYARPPVSRASSSNAVSAGGTPRPGASTPRPGETPAQQHRKRLSSLPIGPGTTAPLPKPLPEQIVTTTPYNDDGDGDGDASQSPGPAESSSPSSSASSSPAQSRIIRRPPRFQVSNPSGAGAGADRDGQNAADDEDDDAEPAFLPFKGEGQYSDPSATLRGDPRELHLAKQRLSKEHQHLHHRDRIAAAAAASSQHSDSSTSSAAMIHKSPGRGSSSHLGPLSPRRTAELSGRSPGGKGKGYSRDGSDGGTSMGSSFSDLDDASVTQSALEEALASKMQNDRTIGSTMSTIGQAFRSRYLPKGNRPPSEGR